MLEPITWLLDRVIKMPVYNGRERGGESHKNLSVCDNGQHGKTCEAVREGKIIKKII